MSTTVINVRSFPLVAGKRILPEGVVYIGRAVPRVGLRKSPWANPYRPKPITSDLPPFLRHVRAAEHLFDYQRDVERRLKADPRFLDPLRGMQLACWCAPKPCHGDVLVDLIETHPMVPQPGEPIIFGLHRQPEADAETAEAWPSRPAFRRQFDRRVDREMRKVAR